MARRTNWTRPTHHPDHHPAAAPMICERCQGSGFVPRYKALWNFTGDARWYDPCPDCNGSGITYCCDEAGSNQPNVEADHTPHHMGET